MTIDIVAPANDDLIDIVGDQDEVGEDDTLELSVVEGQINHNLVSDAVAGSGDYASDADFDPFTGERAIAADASVTLSVLLGGGANSLTIVSPELLQETIRFESQPGQGSDQLVGPDSNVTWSLSETDGLSGALESGGVVFAGIESLVGGAERDTFVVNPANVVRSALDGGPGLDAIDFSGAATPVEVDLQAGTASGLQQPFLEIEDVIGGSASDTILGDDNPNRLEGGAGADLLNDGRGNDVLVGGTAGDTYVWELGGDDQYADDDGEMDVFDFSRVNAPTIVTWSQDATTVTSADGSLSGMGTIEAFVGNGLDGSQLVIDAENVDVEIDVQGSELRVGDREIRFTQMPLVVLRNATQIHLKGDGSANEITLSRRSANELGRVDFGADFTVSYEQGALNLVGGDGDDTLVVREDATHGLPMFDASANSHHTNPAFLATGAQDVVGLHFSGGLGRDAIEVELAAVHDVSYFADELNAAKSGLLGIDDNFAISFSGLDPLVLAGSGGTVLVDASSAALVTQLTIADDPADRAGVGGNRVFGNGAVEDTFFSGFDSLRVVSGEGAEVITLASVDPSLEPGNRLRQIEISADSSLTPDVADDQLVVEQLPARITASLNGGPGADEFRIGGADHLADILGTITIDGGQPAPTDSGTVDPTIVTADSVSRPAAGLALQAGDSLVVSDSASTETASYVLDDTSLSRRGLDLIDFVNVETVSLTTTQGSASVLIGDTADRTTLSVTTQSEPDTIVVVATGQSSIVHLSTGAGDDRATVLATGQASVLTLDSGAGRDSVDLRTTGASGGVSIATGSESDTIEVAATGNDGAVLIDAGGNADSIQIQSQSADSAVEVNGGDDDDRVVLQQSTLASRTRLDGGAGADQFELGFRGTLSNLRGTLTIDGGIPLAGTSPTVANLSDSVIAIDQARPDPQLELNVGDRMTLNDANEVSPVTYNLRPSQLERSGLPPIQYDGIETLDLMATMGEGTVLLETTDAATVRRITTGPSNDNVQITTTGAGSLVRVATGAGDDTVNVATTGSDSVLRLDVGADADQVQIQDTGSGSGTSVAGRTESDQIRISNVGVNSTLRVDAGAGPDRVRLDNTRTDSSVEINGDQDADTLTVLATALDSQTRLVGGAGPDQLILGTAASLNTLQGPIEIQGGSGQDNDGPTVGNDFVEAAGLARPISPLAPESGDQLRLDDSAAPAGLDYSITQSSISRNGAADIRYAGLEQLHLQTGAGPAGLVVTDTAPSLSTVIAMQGTGNNIQIDSTGTNSVTRLAAGDGGGQIIVNGTGRGSGMAVTSRGANAIQMNATGANSATLFDLGDGADEVTIDGTGIESGVEARGNAGQDVLRVQRTPATSHTIVQGGADADEFTLGRADSLQGILGTVSIDGGGPPITENGTLAVSSVTAHGVTRPTPELSPRTGDALFVRDSQSVDTATYTLDTDSFGRTGMGSIGLANLETTSLSTTRGSAAITILGTLAGTTTDISTQAEPDTVTVAATGQNSVVRLSTGEGDDVIPTSSTGQSSVLVVETGGGRDTVSLAATGQSSGVSVSTGTEVDEVTVVDTGADSALLIDVGPGSDSVVTQSQGVASALEIVSGEGDDVVSVQQSSRNSRSLLSGNEGVDTFELGLDGSLAGLLGSLTIDGGMPVAGFDADGTNLSDAVVAADLSRPDPALQLILGDRLVLADAAETAAMSYTLEPTQLDRSGLEPIQYAGIETIELSTTAGEGELVVESTGPETMTQITLGPSADTIQLGNTGVDSVVRISKGDGDDALTVSTTGENSVTRVDSGAGADSIRVLDTGSGSGTYVASDQGDDVIEIATVGGNGSLRVDAGSGDDAIELENVPSDSAVELNADAGADRVNVFATSIGSRTLITSGAGADIIGLGRNGSLSEIAGPIEVQGGSEPTGIVMADESSSVEANDLQRPDPPLDSAAGDRLLLNDSNSPEAFDYTIDPTLFTRTGMAEIDYREIELFRLQTSQSAAGLVVSNSAATTSTEIVTQDNDDRVVIQTTGTNSVVRLSMNDGDDHVTVNNTGQGSGLHITAAGDNGVQVNATGVDSATLIQLGAGDDMVTLAGNGIGSGVEVQSRAGSDRLTVERTSGTSRTRVNAGDSPDEIILGVENSLDGLLGEVSIIGGNPTMQFATEVRESVTAQGVERPSPPLQLAAGDQLMIRDSMTQAGVEYTLGPMTLERSRAATIDFREVETIDLATTAAIANVRVTDTAARTTTRIATAEQSDNITILSTGSESVVRVSTAEGSDQVQIETTGEASMLKVESGADNDTVSVRGTGVGSGTEIDGQAGALHVEVITSGEDSVLRLVGGDANDVFSFQPPLGDVSQLMAVTEVIGNGNDDDSVPATTGVQMTEGTPDLFTEVVDGAVATHVRPTTESIELGDLLILDASLSPIARNYELLSSRLVISQYPIFYSSLERINVLAADQNDTLRAFLPEASAPEFPDLVQYHGGGGIDSLRVLGSSGNDVVSVGQSNSSNRFSAPSFTVDKLECFHARMNRGSDIVINDTLIPSVLAGGPGDDTLIGSTAADAIFGGAGVDHLFGNLGGDYLFGDVDFQGTIRIDDGDRVVGNLGHGNDPGVVDTGVSLNSDSPDTQKDLAAELEDIIEEGSIKDVNSWLRARFPEFTLTDNGDGTFSSPQISAAVAQAKRDLGVNEMPCQWAFQPPTPVELPENRTGTRSVESAANTGSRTLAPQPSESFHLSVGDVNRDGTVSPVDALLVINALNGIAVDDRFDLDINHDGEVTPIDALLIVNELNANAPSDVASAVAAQAGRDFDAT